MFLKLVYNKQIHIFSKKPTFQQLQEFIQLNFTGLPEHYDIVYFDLDGDRISVTNNHDIEAMFEVNDSRFLKLEIRPSLQVAMTQMSLEEPEARKMQMQKLGSKISQCDEDQEEKSEQSNSKRKKVQFEQPVEPEESRKQMKSVFRRVNSLPMPGSEAEGTQLGCKDEFGEDFESRKTEADSRQQCRVTPLMICSAKQMGYSQRPLSEQSKDQATSKPSQVNNSNIDSEYIQKLWEHVEERTRKLIEKTLNGMTQTIIDRTKAEIVSENAAHQHSSTVHINVKCDNCGVSPITGIRYKCPVCSNYDLCQTCQNSGAHPHDLLKIRNSQSRNYLKVKSTNTTNNNALNSNPPQKQNVKKLEPEEVNAGSVQLRAKKLSQKFGGIPEDYKCFAQETKGLMPWEANRAYMDKYKAIPVQSPERGHKRAWKLSYLLQRPYDEMIKFVADNPGLNIYKLKSLYMQSHPEMDPQNRAQEAKEAQQKVETQTKPQPIPKPSDALNELPSDQSDLAQKQLLLDVLKPIVEKNVELLGFVRKYYAMDIPSAVALYFQQQTLKNG